MTDLLYLPDEDDVTEFTATVTAATEAYVVLDGTYFYPEGGGQPADRGELRWEGGHADVVDVRKDHGDVRHYVESLEGDPPVEETAVEGHVDVARRETLRRMHTAQHVVSRVVLEEYGATTAGNQIHEDRSRIDFEPADFDEEDLAFIERETNAVIERDLPVTKENRVRAAVEAGWPRAGRSWTSSPTTSTRFVSSRSTTTTCVPVAAPTSTGWARSAPSTSRTGCRKVPTWSESSSS